MPETLRLGKYTQDLTQLDSGPDSASVVIQILNEFLGIKLLQNGLNAESLYRCVCSAMLYHYLINQKV